MMSYKFIIGESEKNYSKKYRGWMLWTVAMDLSQYSSLLL